MTQTPELVAVTRSDRVAAWPFRPSCYKDDATCRHNWNDGVYDKIAVIQSFARHRISHASPSPAAMREAAAGVADAEATYRRQCQKRALKKSEARDFESMAIACVQVAAAIRNLPLPDAAAPLPQHGEGG